MVRIYAVSCDNGRQERLLKASEPLNLDIVFIQSPLKNDPEVLRRGKTELEKGTGEACAIACLLGHFRAMQRFIDDGSDVGIIIEDDIRFHKDFNEIVEKLMKDEWYKDHNVFSLGFCSYPVDFDNEPFIIKNVGLSNPWGAQCYMITRDFAIHLLGLFKDHDDVSEVVLTHFVTDWTIFEPRFGCKRCTLKIPIAVESPDEASIVGNYNKPDMIALVDKSMFYW